MRGVTPKLLVLIGIATFLGLSRRSALLHGNTGAIKYWPGYLKHVLQEHLKHHGEEIYEQAKALRTIAENILLSLGKARQQRRSRSGCCYGRRSARYSARPQSKTPFQK